MTSRVISRAARRLPRTEGARRAVAAVAAAALLVTGAGLVLGPALTAGASSPTLPFDLVPSTGSHLVFAHYFTPYPVVTAPVALTASSGDGALQPSRSIH